MKQILSFLLFLLPALAFAQWPAAPNKIRLGNQTTGDGLIVRTDSIPDWTPATNRDAWVAFDTVAGVLYYYEGGVWNSFAGGDGNGLFDAANEGDTLLVNTAILSDLGLTLESQDTKTTVEIVPGQLRFSVESSAFIMTEQDVEIVASGVTAISAFENHLTLYPDTIELAHLPENNSLTRIVGIDDVTNRLGYIERDSLQTGGGGVQYSDSLTTFVTPSQLSDSLAANVNTYANGLTLASDTVKLGGALTANTTISGDFTLTRSGSVATNVFNASNSNGGFTSSAITGTSTGSGRGVYGQGASGYGVYGVSSSSYGVLGTSTTGYAVGGTGSRAGFFQGTSNTSPSVLISNAGSAPDTTFSSAAQFQAGAGSTDSTSVFPVLSAVRTQVGGARPQNGMGISFPWFINTLQDTVSNAIASREVFNQRVKLTDRLTGSASSEYEILLRNNDVLSRVARIAPSGQLTLDGYTTNTFIGTGWARLAVDASGVVVADTTTTSGGGANLAYTGTADVIELDAGGTSVFIAEGSGVDVAQSGDTLTITGKGTRFVQDSITGATLTVDLNEAPTAIISLKMTSATSVTLTINNPYGFLTDATAPTYEGETGVYTFRFWGISGTDNVTWPANFYDMNGTALGTDALTAGTAYTCYYDPIANEYYCK